MSGASTPSGRVAWLDVSGGVSGDMLLGSLVDAGCPVAVIQDAVDALGLPERVTITTERVRRGGLAALRVHVDVAEPKQIRRLDDIHRLIGDAALPDDVKAAAQRVFSNLAEAEAAVHGTTAQDVHFHEVGALDSLADVVGTVAGMQWLGLERLVCGTFALGGGRAATEHGLIPVPGPAVLELLHRVAAPARGGPVDMELATPTGMALALTLADGFGPMPELRVTSVGVGAGSRNPPEHLNVVRLVIGQADGSPAGIARRDNSEVDGALVIEANVDDLDPRLWPHTLAVLIERGASDAWLTPILMKKGRPAHTLSVLVREDLLETLLDVVFAHTSTIGVRIVAAVKVALDRRAALTDYLGHPIRAKVASRHGTVMNVSLEYDDLVSAATATGVPPKIVLDAARARLGLLDDNSPPMAASQDPPATRP